MKFDGKALASEIYLSLQHRVATLEQSHITPHLAVIFVGDNPASKLYIAQKKKWSKYIGADLTVLEYPVATTTDELLKVIADLNENNSIHGIIVQRPLPEHINKEKLAIATIPAKDIDGFHPQTRFIIPVAAAVIRILEEAFKQTKHSSSYMEWLSKKQITIIGKGDTAGQPIIDHLRKLQLSPTIIDSKTTSVSTILNKSDIVISSVGKKNIVRAEDLKPNAIVIGVGITKDREEGTIGDFDETAVAPVASFYTPTPGGVGPVNVAYLLQNLVEAAEKIK